VRFLACCALVCALAAAATAALAGERDPARLSLYVFFQGRPVPGLPVSVDGIEKGRTSEEGAFRDVLAPGRRQIQIGRPDGGVLDLEVVIQAGESVQAVVGLPGEGGVPAVDIESSRVGTVVPDREDAAGSGEKGPPGTVKGRVVDVESGEPVAGARIFVSGAAREAQTDENGAFAVDVSPGTYSLSVIHTDYSTRTLDGLHVEAGKTVTADVQLTPADVELADFVVTAPYLEGSVASIIDIQRSADSVTEVIGAEQMSKAGDSDAADALQRVTGLTVEDGKFVLIRGLPPRYTKTLWNGCELPSPDPNGRLVPLDMFPTDVLQSVQVQKSFSPDQPGSFGGGLIQLQTRRIPEKSFFEVSTSAGFNSETTGKKGLVYEGGKWDFLGFDDGTRDLPSELDRITDSDRRLAKASITNPDGFTDEELEALGESFPNTYKIGEETAAPDLGLGVSGGLAVERPWGRFGFLGSFLYDHTWENTQGPERSFSLSGDRLLVADDYSVFETARDTTVGCLITIGGELGEDHEVTGNTLLLRKTTDRAEIREGRRSENDQDVREFTLEFPERELLSQQFLGTHRLPPLHGLTADWRAMFSRSTRQSHDRRFYRYILLEEPVFDGSSLERRYADLEDSGKDMGLDLSMPFGEEDTLALTMKAGYAYATRERTSDTKRFQFEWDRGAIPSEIATMPNPELIFTEENIGPGRFIVDDLTGANDDSRGDQTVTGGFVMGDVTILDVLRLTAGFRREKSTINISTFQASAGGGESAVDSTLETSSVLPSASAVLTLFEDMQIRASYGESVSRPDFREISPAQFIDPVTDDTFVGNPELKETEISSVDLRLEWYPSGTEQLSLGVFQKDFTNPIETVKIPGFNSPRTFQNADTAESRGVEIGFRKTLGFFREGWERFYAEGNVSFIKSTVQLSEDTLFTNTNRSRELQGQAPYVANFKFGYEGDRLDATLLFNMVGERITEVGVQGQPDITLQPAPRLDFVLQYTFANDLKLKFALKNILDPEIEYTQGDEVQRSFKHGWDVGLSLSVPLWGGR